MLTTPHGMDLRGFRSRLTPLLAKLDAELQAAQCALASSRATAATLDEQVQRLREVHSREAAAMASGLHGVVDAAAHERSLRHLLSLARQVSARDADLRKAEEEVSHAVKCCVERDRHKAVVERMQERELRAHTLLASRRQAREADLEWLAHCGGVGTGLRWEGGRE